MPDSPPEGLPEDYSALSGRLKSALKEEIAQIARELCPDPFPHYTREAGDPNPKSNYWLWPAQNGADAFMAIDVPKMRQGEEYIRRFILSDNSFAAMQHAFFVMHRPSKETAGVFLVDALCKHHRVFFSSKFAKCIGGFNTGARRRRERLREEIGALAELG